MGSQIMRISILSCVRPMCQCLTVRPTLAGLSTRALGVAVTVDEMGETRDIPAVLTCLEVVACPGAEKGGSLWHTLTDAYDFFMAHEVAWGLVRMHAKKLRALVQSNEDFDVFGHYALKVVATPLSICKAGTSGEMFWCTWQAVNYFQMLLLCTSLPDLW